MPAEAGESKSMGENSRIDSDSPSAAAEHSSLISVATSLNARAGEFSGEPIESSAVGVCDARNGIFAIHVMAIPVKAIGRIAVAHRNAWMFAEDFPLRTTAHNSGIANETASAIHRVIGLRSASDGVRWSAMMWASELAIETIKTRRNNDSAESAGGATVSHPTAQAQIATASERDEGTERITLMPNLSTETRGTGIAFKDVQTPCLSQDHGPVEVGGWPSAVAECNREAEIRARGV